MSVMASRFSVLRIEGDSDQEREKAARKKEAEEKSKKKLTKKKKKSKPAETADPELQSMAFGMPKPRQQAKLQQQQQKQQQQQQQQQQKTDSESPRKPSESEQSEWEKRDQALIDEAFERDLEQAMLMSSVDSERAATEPPPPAANGHDEPPKGKAAKKAKTNVLSVDQLQTLSNTQIDRGDFISTQAAAAAVRPPAAAASAGGDGRDFFDHMERKAKAVVRREKVIESIRQDLPPSAAGSAVSPELQLRLATAESQVEEMAAELERTKDELKLAKARTKRVLSVLTQSETKEKVQLIVSLEKAQAAREAADKERADMSAQVTALLAQLEQERSKVHGLSTQLKRAQGNKRRGVGENDAADAVD